VAVGKDDRQWERRCHSAAARVLFVTRSLLELHLQAFSTLERRRCRVVLNGWEPGDFRRRTAACPALRRAKLTRIGYFGFMADHQPPRQFLESIERLIDSRKLARSALRIRIAGVVDGSALESLTGFRYESILEPYRWVDRRRAVRLMMQCAALLIINDPRMCRALPTKLFDYLASGRPILVYGNGESEMSRLVTRLRAGVCVPTGDDTALATALERLRESPVSHWQGPARMRFLEQHTRAEMARRMLTEIRAAIRSHHS
jgi:glycosyltransferase involved in cell wall biosynthesis